MRPIRRRRGAVLVYTVIVIMMLIAFVGLTLDWAYVYGTGQQLQNAADAAALAGARQVSTSQASARAKSIAFAAANQAGGKAVVIADNPQNAAAGDVVIGVYNRAQRTFTPSSQAGANAVRAVARRTQGSGSGAGSLPLFFGPVFGKQTAEVSRAAVAMAEVEPVTGSILALDPHAPQAFYLHGNPTVDVGTGIIQVDSDSNSALDVKGSKAALIASEVDIVGRYSTSGNPTLPTIKISQPFVADPLAALPAPTVGTAMTPAKIGGTRTFDPGYYPQGLDMKAGDNVLLRPGVYVLDGGFNINGHAQLTGAGVMIYLKSGALKQNGTGDVYLTPPTSGAYAGISFFQARANTSTASFTGNGQMTGTGPGDTVGTGAFYFPNAALEVGGTSDVYVSKLIAKTIEVSGNGTKHVTKGFDASKGGTKVYLVE